MPESGRDSEAGEPTAVRRCEVDEEQSSAASDQLREPQWHGPYGTHLAGVTFQNPLNNSPLDADHYKDHVPTTEFSQDNLATPQTDEMVQDEVDRGLLFEQGPFMIPLQ